jgi:hypothetical protein
MKSDVLLRPKVLSTPTSLNQKQGLALNSEHNVLSHDMSLSSHFTSTSILTLYLGYYLGDAVPCKT